MINRGAPQLPSRRPLAVTHWSTDGILPERRFAAWMGRPWPSMVTLFDTTLLEEFETTSDHVLLGDMVVQFAHGTCRRYQRTAERVAADRVAILAMSLLVTGRATGDAAGRPFEAGPGTIVLLDMARVSDVLLTRGTSIQLTMPRAFAERHLGSLENFHGAVVPAVRAKLLVKHLQAVRKVLPTLTVEHGPALARVIAELLGVALNRDVVAPGGSAETPSIELAVKEHVERALNLGPVREKDVCTTFRLSRTTVHRLFRSNGGFQSYVRLRRLENVRLALLSHASRETVAELAQRWGFSDASHLSRLFKRVYGVTLAAYRADKPRIGADVP